MKKGRDVYIVGVGMTKFERSEKGFPQLAKEAGEEALKMAGIKYNAVEQAYCGYVTGMSTSGQRAVYGLGMTGIPVYNVNNNCSSGSTAMYLGYQAVSAGINECVLALGFEKMEKGPLENTLQGKKLNEEERAEQKKKVPMTARIFGDAGRAHMKEYGTTKEDFAKISVKNHNHSVNNPRSQYQDPCTLQEVLESREVYDPLTLLQCCPTSDGSAAVILASEEFVKKNNLLGSAVKIRSMTMTTDKMEDFALGPIGMAGYGMTKAASKHVYEEAGVAPTDIQVIELHDCFSTNELLSYEGLELVEQGEAVKLVRDGANTYGGQWVINPSGGLLSKGHPMGATGLAQASEIVWQLTGQADKRQVEGARLGLTHNLGLGGACVVGIYEGPSS
ncbi:MAG TPA: lipid-transfer protein [Gammaproteobacteria bacterium]|nr:lipid-transfer protein [Gammaproteobacteria bacterium]